MPQQKKHYPKKENKSHYSPLPKKKYYPKPPHPKPPNISSGFFNGNLAPNMQFGGPNDELSGYVKRKIVVRDARGNETRASEIQFFNSGKKIKININGNESENN